MGTRTVTNRRKCRTGRHKRPPECTVHNCAKCFGQIAKLSQNSVSQVDMRGLDLAAATEEGSAGHRAHTLYVRGSFRNEASAARSVGIANRNTRYPDLHKIALTIYSATYILDKPCLSVPPSCSSGKPRRLARGPIAKAVARLIGFDRERCRTGQRDALRFAEPIADKKSGATMRLIRGLSFLAALAASCSLFGQTKNDEEAVRNLPMHSAMPGQSTTVTTWRE